MRITSLKVLKVKIKCLIVSDKKNISCKRLFLFCFDLTFFLIKSFPYSKERERASSPILSSSETTPLSLSTDIIKLSGPLFVADHGSEHLNSDIKVQKIENA